MDKKVTLGYTTPAGQQKEIEVEVKEESVQLLQYMNKPLALIKNAGKLGVKGVKSFFVIFILFCVTNLIFLISSIIYIFINSGNGLLSLVIVILLGIIITGLAAYKAYNYVFIDTLRVIYQGSTSLLRKISEAIVNKSSALIEKQADKSAVASGINAIQVINDILSSLPKVMRKGLTYLLNKVPLSNFLKDINSLVVKGDKETAVDLLYTKTDTFIMDTVFGNNNKNWVYWLLPLNIILQILIIRAAW